MLSLCSTTLGSLRYPDLGVRVGRHVFFVFFHIWYMTSHHATQKPSHFSGVITAVMGTGNLPISVHQKQVHVS